MTGASGSDSSVEAKNNVDRAEFFNTIRPQEKQLLSRLRAAEALSRYQWSRKPKRSEPNITCLSVGECSEQVISIKGSYRSYQVWHVEPWAMLR